MKKILALIIALALSLCFAGCGGTEKPDIDINQISNWINDTGYMNDYDYVTDWAVVPDDSGGVNISIVVEDGTDPELALHVADNVVRQVSVAARNQNKGLTSPSKDDYGSFYDSYPALVGVSEQSNTGDTKDWLVFHAIVASSGPMVELQK